MGDGIRTHDSLQVPEEWAARLINLGRQVQVTTPGGVLAGWAEGVDADGALILRTCAGQRRRIVVGDVTLRRD